MFCEQKDLLPKDTTFHFVICSDGNAFCRTYALNHDSLENVSESKNKLLYYVPFRQAPDHSYRRLSTGLADAALTNR